MKTKWTVWYRQADGILVTHDLWSQDQVSGYLQALQNIGIKPTNCGYSRAKISSITGQRRKIVDNTID